ncbi:MAG: DUF1700 domain-containing protein [Lachnospiraceae bacterium]|nr:DUF1700 domain-containing protein [Lachnospiraceae bacterium]MDD3659663.1 DUF1700 domain-containing protein [Lachnospiraceae bacterium]
MNRIEFLRQLEVLLSGISQSEKEEAIQYYNDYFDDAGAENETEVIRALGSPAKVAETIKSGLSGKNQDDLEFTERGCSSKNVHYNEVMPVQHEEDKKKGRSDSRDKAAQGGYTNGYANAYQNSGNQGGSQQNQNSGQNYQNQNYNGQNPYGQGGSTNHKNDTGKIVLIVLLLILFSPVWIPVFGGIFGTLIGLGAALIGIFIAIAASAVALIVAGIVIFGVSIAKLFVAPLIGIFLLGASLLVTGLGILLMLLTIWLGGTVIPACFRGVVKLCRMPFERRGGQVA